MGYTIDQHPAGFDLSADTLRALGIPEPQHWKEALQQYLALRASNHPLRMTK